MIDQTEIGVILRDFEKAAQEYRDHIIDMEELHKKDFIGKLSCYIHDFYSREEMPTGMIRAEQLSDANREIWRRGLVILVAGLNSHGIDAAEEMHRLVRAFLEDLAFYLPSIPDDENCIVGGLIGFLHEKYQIDDIWDPAQKRRELDDLSQRIRETVSAFLQSCS